MANVRLYSPFYQWLTKPFLDEEWPSITLNEGMDVFEEDGKIVAKASVAGVPPDKVNVTFDDNTLRITAKVEESEEERKKRKMIYRRERLLSFDYATVLPKPIDEKSIEAVIENGVVTVTANVMKEVEPKKIVVKTSVKK